MYQFILIRGKANDLPTSVPTHTILRPSVRKKHFTPQAFVYKAWLSDLSGLMSIEIGKPVDVLRTCKDYIAVARTIL